MPEFVTLDSQHTKTKIMFPLQVEIYFILPYIPHNPYNQITKTNNPVIKTNNQISKMTITEVGLCL